MRMARRIAHTLARSGWLLFAALGALVMVVSAVTWAADPVERGDDPFAAMLIGGLVVFVPIGAIVGALVGLPIQFAARALQRPVTGPSTPSHGLGPGGPWAEAYEACARSVASFHTIVATVSSEAGRDWLAGIGETLDGELAEALRLARIGESLAPSGTPTGTALTVQDMLAAAEKAFAETTDRAAVIALDLRADSDFTQVRAQLDMLAEQAPRLRAAELD
jgi:hypothetical protein